MNEVTVSATTFGFVLVEVAFVPLLPQAASATTSEATHSVTPRRFVEDLMIPSPFPSRVTTASTLRWPADCYSERGR
ncbi:MAG: hypothetical protein ACXVKA_06215 [Acidimicrobiia bacterium]